ncbi:MAG: helix-turn-helix transcriptional regulator [Saccharofermentanales bacterium]
MGFYQMTTGERIKEARLNKGLSQNQLVERLNNNGSKITRTSISLWENGHRDIRLDKAIELCKALEISLDELME